MVIKVKFSIFFQKINVIVLLLNEINLSMFKYSCILVLISLFSMACKTVNNVQAPAKSPSLLIGKWQVSTFEFRNGRVMPGAFMGYPQYEFTEDGYRIKTLNTEPSPPPDSIPYEVYGDSIRYPKHPKFPRMHIQFLQKDSLVLRNEKLTWFLHQ